MMRPNITLLFFHHLRQTSSSFLFTISKPHFFLFFFFFISSSSSSASLRHACDPKTLTNATFLRSDQLTVLISGFSTSRLPLLRSLASSYASSPSVAAVLILWFNPHTPSQTLSKALDLPSSSSAAAPISLISHPSSSLNARFLPRRQIRTRAVAVCDDDIDLPPPSLEFAFKIWRSDQARLVGFFARSHDLDLDRRSWIYTVHPDRFSMVLTKFMILGTRYLHRYSCAPEYREMRAVVDRMRNCEDILMNFLVAHEAGVGPTLVGARRKVRDWGDLRNDDDDDDDKKNSSGGGSENVGSVGISKRVGHMERRGECIREFHRGLGRMPLRYSYGKVIEGLGEQGLCEKEGKLVLCDE
ncbi:glycosyltransferase family protein 64 C3 [Cinnamomum micranthum f. kanehirae]|uniref:Glycosyltransferase family protein 64 C3 n=1 Tax=Cinnamomum micranthum f. kanehirae TaxID=337451 RepID=A0A443PL76_9MAGN|nr:glycosyltransferase family protein 64 C3 [Cinnamomum micranthum f. kanehirae]